MEATTTRRRGRRSTRTIGATLLAATLAVAASGVARSAEAPVGTGSSAVAITPATLGVDLPLADELDANLGRLLLDASNVGVPVARLAFEGLGAAGQGAAPIALSSADGDKRGGDEREAAAAGFSALVGLVDYAVEAGDGAAQARIGALSGALTTPLGLGAELDAQQVASTVTGEGAASQLRLTVSGLQLGLGDLLPADVLAGLPLGVVLDLVDGLDLVVPAPLGDQLAALDGLIPLLEDTLAADGDLADAEARLAALIAADPTLAALQDAVDDAGAAVAAAQLAVDNATVAVGVATVAVAALETEVAAIEQAIADLDAEAALLDPITGAVRLLAIAAELLTLDADLTQAEADLADAQADLAAAEALLATAQATLVQAQQDLTDAVADLAAAVESLAGALVAEIERLQQLVDDLVAELTGLLTGLDLVELRLDLLDLLTSTPLLDLGAMTLDLRTTADGATSLGQATCTVGPTTVLGAVVPTPDCATLSGALGQVSDAIGAALASLPISVPIPAVTASGPTIDASGAGVPDAAGLTSASVDVTPVRLAVPSVALRAVVDDLVADLEAQLAALLGGAPAPTGELDGLLAALVSDLDALPVGDALAGLRTNGLDATLATIGLSSTFTAQQVAVPVDDGPAGSDPVPGGGTTGGGGPVGGTPTGTPTGAPTGGAPTPSSPGEAPRSAPAPSGTLPRTGTEVMTLIAVAAAAMAAGGTTLVARRQLVG